MLDVECKTAHCVEMVYDRDDQKEAIISKPFMRLVIILYPEVKLCVMTTNSDSLGRSSTFDKEMG